MTDHRTEHETKLVIDALRMAGNIYVTNSELLRCGDGFEMLALADKLESKPDRTAEREAPCWCWVCQESRPAIHRCYPMCAWHDCDTRLSKEDFREGHRFCRWCRERD